MSIKKLFFGIVILMAILFVLSATIYRNLTIDIHFHDTYYIITAVYVAVFCLFLSDINYILYKIKGNTRGKLNHWLCILHIAFFALATMLLCWAWVLQEKLFFSSFVVSSYFLSSAILSFIISEMILVVYIFLPKAKAG
jgi:hypothetical protein